MRNRIEKIVTIPPNWHMNYYLQYKCDVIITLSFKKANLYKQYKYYLIRRYEK
jgi:hypothetical protein